MSKEVTIEHILSSLRKRVMASSQKAVASALEISPQYLNDVLNERREPGKAILKRLGFKKVIKYVLDEYY